MLRLQRSGLPGLQPWRSGRACRAEETRMTIPPEARAAAFKAVGEAISGPGRLRKRQDIILVALQAAAPLLVEQGAAAERQRIRQLAIQMDARCAAFD